jgi:predicted nucleic acid-binding protein
VIVLDTNVISEIVRPQPNVQVVTWLEALSDDVAITAVTLAELLAGVRRLPSGKRRSALSAAIDEVLTAYNGTRSVLAFDADAARAYADVFVRRERAGLPIGMADAQIAAICLAHAATCATRNAKDFAHTGVDIVNPWTV